MVEEQLSLAEVQAQDHLLSSWEALWEMFKLCTSDGSEHAIHLTSSSTQAGPVNAIMGAWLQSDAKPEPFPLRVPWRGSVKELGAKRLSTNKAT